MPGFLVGHRELMANMEAHTFGVELNYTHKSARNHLIDSNYRKLRWGIAFDYFNMGNATVNGEAYAAIINAEANIRTRTHSRTAFRVGTGIGYLTRRFDIHSNPKNSAIGSHVNGSMQIMFLHQVTVSKRFELNLGLGVTHFSNGNFRKPNLGVNMAHLVLGTTYFINRTEKDQKQRVRFFPKSGFEIAASIARKQVSIQDPTNFTIGIGSITYYRPKSEARNWRIGGDVFFDRSDPYEQFQRESAHHIKVAKMTEVGLRAGHEFVFGRVCAVTDLGCYLYKATDTKRRFYFSIGLSYSIFKNVVVSNRLKSHLAVADYFQWGAGYRISDSFLRKSK